MRYFRSNKNKYNNRKIENEFGKFDSVKEYHRYRILLALLKSKKISQLHRQVRYELIPPQYEVETIQLKTKTKEKQRLVEEACHYVADFVYLDEQGNTIVEDVKSEATRQDKVFVIKRKLMLHVHGIKLKIVD